MKRHGVPKGYSEDILYVIPRAAFQYFYDHCRETLTKKYQEKNGVNCSDREMIFLFKRWIVLEVMSPARIYQNGPLFKKKISSVQCKIHREFLMQANLHSTWRIANVVDIGREWQPIGLLSRRLLTANVIPFWLGNWKIRKWEDDPRSFLWIYGAYFSHVAPKED